MPTLLIVLGTLIVLVLAAYAASLLWKLKKQTQAREAAIAERKAAADKRREEDRKSVV